MNRWEKFCKGMIKAALWAVVFLLMLCALSIQDTWSVFAVVIVCYLWDRMLDLLIPTDQDKESGKRTTSIV